MLHSFIKDNDQYVNLKLEKIQWNQLQVILFISMLVAQGKTNF